MIDFGLEDRIAIVTGASRGLGHAIALALIEQGARVLAAARSSDGLRTLQAVAPERVRACECDMRDASAVVGLANLAIDAFGGLDIVVNNAGIAPAGQFLEQPEEVWREVMEVNVLAPMLLARAAGRHMVPRGSGKIINIASTSGILGKASLAAYSASKGALVQFTKALAAEWAGAGVQVNAIAPGAFSTDAQRVVLNSPDLLARRTRKIPARRMGESSEIGPLACYLASDRSAFVTGSVFVIDGGESSCL